ncbi:CGCGG family rSAM-modified RiPP protein [Halobacteriales archaeon QS_1_68_17]|nr:MAG: CGCGG family rSAM-modified RiPP protein [Halobacteriales archaeon QS_1_68_17]
MGHASDQAHESDAEPVTDRIHDNSWPANLETPRYAGDRAAVVEGALTAIDHTAPGNHVNLVTRGDNGHPERYLYQALEDAVDGDLDWEYVQQCGCGGHVTRVSVESAIDVDRPASDSDCCDYFRGHVT